MVLKADYFDWLVRVNAYEFVVELELEAHEKAQLEAKKKKH